MKIKEIKSELHRVAEIEDPQECPQRRDIMAELRFIRAVDGALEEDEEFLPFFCDVLKECQSKKY